MERKDPVTVSRPPPPLCLRVLSAFVIVLVITLGGFMASAIRYEARHPCIRSHTERVWIPQSTQYVPISIDDNQVVQVPVTTPGYWSESAVCDAREGIIRAR